MFALVSEMRLAGPAGPLVVRPGGAGGAALGASVSRSAKLTPAVAAAGRVSVITATHLPETNYL